MRAATAASWARRLARTATSGSITSTSSKSRSTAGLRPAVDRYFDDVLVMDPDVAVRSNRLAQLAAVAALIGSLGEFSRLPLAQA